MRRANRNVAKVLEEQGRSLKWLCAQLGMERTRVSHILMGYQRYRVPAAFYERISGILAVPVARVLPGDPADEEPAA